MLLGTGRYLKFGYLDKYGQSPNYVQTRLHSASLEDSSTHKEAKTEPWCPERMAAVKTLVTWASVNRRLAVEAVGVPSTTNTFILL